MVRQQLKRLKLEYGSLTHTKGVPNTIRICKICGSDYIIRDGVINGIQRWECRACGRKFLNNSAIPGMKAPFWQLRPALFMYYEGISLNIISRMFEQEYHSYISAPSIYRWTKSIPQRIREIANNFQHKLGTTWIVGRHSVDTRKHDIYIWDIVDKNTRFLLSTHFSLDDTSTCIESLLDKATTRAGKFPELLISDDISSLFYVISHSTNNISFIIDKPTIELVFNDTFSSRNRLLSKMKNLDGIKRFLEGWDIHYNYFKPQIALGNKTPGEMAGIHYNSLIYQIKHNIFRSEYRRY